MDEHEDLILEAEKAGNEDGYFDGIDGAWALACRCEKCHAAYVRGYEAGQTRLKEEAQNG